METLGVEPKQAWLAINLHLIAFATLWSIVLGGVNLIDRIVTNDHRERCQHAGRGQPKPLAVG